jgi:hypothetical protein
MLTLPFGIYMRYLFKRNFTQTLIWSFLLTLSFELLQRSALFGLYPRPYRLFDVDDLLINTLGSLLGFALALFLVKILPDLEASFVESSRVSLFRRFIAFGVDLFLMSILALIIPMDYAAEVIIFLVIPLFFKATLGQMLLKIKIYGNRPRILLRQLLSFVNFALVYLELYLLHQSGILPEEQLAQNYLLSLIVLALIAIPVLDVIFAGAMRTRKLWYERVSGTHIVIKTKQNEEEM